MPKKVEKYGLLWDEGYPELFIELRCYRESRGQDVGGLGAYQHFKNAWKLAWPLFEYNEWTDMMVLAWCTNTRVSIMGGSGVGKTYNMSHIVLLDYIADPLHTMTSLTTVTADGLRLRMWGDLMRAFESLPIYVKTMFKVYSSSNRMNLLAAGQGKDSDKYMIEGMATSKTKDASGRIRGKHAPRRRVILDEADDMPPVIYETFPNIMSDPDVKIVDISNAMDRYSMFCRNAEPKTGWDSISDTDQHWFTKDGVCLHFDGLQNPHILSDGKRCKWMITQERINQIKLSFGESSKEWWSFVRGFPPPDGIVSKVWPSFAIEQARKTVTFDFKPEMCASLDPAYEHDDCVLIIAEKGDMRGGKPCIQAKKSIKIQIKRGIADYPADHQVAAEVMRICGEYGVLPRNFIMDKTGNGGSVYGQLCVSWSREINGIEYGSPITDRPIRFSDPRKACDIADRFVSELWIRARYMAEDGCLCGLDNLDNKTIEDLNTRRYEVKQVTKGSRMCIEDKRDLKKRLGRSPDYGDAYCQLAELLVRTGGGLSNPTIRTVQNAWERMRKIAIKRNAVYA